MIKSQIIKHSVNPDGQELVTYELTNPRFIHSEMMTHRMFSRNASSSRAIPIKKMIQQVWNDPACPVRWGSNGKGMQDHGNMTGWRLKLAKLAWIGASKLACCTAWLLEQCGVHKQISNRVLEPWAHITVVMTTALPGLMNFFALRAHKDAQPEFQVLAYKMLRDYLHSVPVRLEWGSWHLPYAQCTELLVDEDKRKVCTGRLARVSYLTHDGQRDMQKDKELHDQLAASGHWCYDATTEVLTSSGFVPWDAVSSSTRLAAYSAENGTVSFETPSAVHKTEYTGKLYAVAGQQIDLRVTPNHRMFVSRRTRDGWQPHGIETAGDIFGKSRRYLVAGKSPKATTAWALPAGISAAFIGFFVGDGYASGKGEISFHVTVAKKKAFVADVLGRPLRWHDAVLSKWLRSNCYTKRGQKKLPDGFMDIPSDEFDGLLLGLRSSDGCVKRGTWVYDSTSQALLDQLQALCCIRGVAAQISKARHTDNPKHKPCRRLNFSNRLAPEVSCTQHGRSYTYTEKWVNYSGLVYCASVSTGLLIVRRNGKICISGNSPFEHCAMASLSTNMGGNFGAGWHQYRKDFPLEIRRQDRRALDERWWDRPAWVNTFLREDTWERTGV